MWFNYSRLLSVVYVIEVCANHHSLIHDYFTFKETSNIVGFSCDSIDEDLSFLRQLNRVNMKAMMVKLNGESISRVIHSDYHKIGIFLDVRCYNSSLVSAALKDAGYHRLYGELHFWLILSYNLESVMKVIDDSSFGISTDFTVAISSAPERYSLYDVYNPWKLGGGQINVTLLASWDVQRRLYLYIKESKIKRRSNLRGLTFTTAFFESKFKPENISLEDYLENSEKNPIDGWSKFGYLVLRLASEMFNFSINIKKIAKWEKGDIVGPMSRALNNNEIDISGNPVRMSGPRLHMSKIIYPSWPLKSCFLFRSPQRNDVKFTYITRPFATDVWILIMITTMLSCLALVFILEFEYDYSLIDRCSNSLLLILGVLCLQSATIHFNNISSRIAFLFILVLGYFINNYYSACIVSVRLDEAIFKVNDSLNELAKTGLKVASEPILFFDFFIKDNQWETKMFYTQRWMTTPENERFILPDRGMQLVKQGSHAYHTYPDVAYPFVNRFYSNREICELTEVTLVRLADNAMAVTYNSTVVELMKVGLTEHGIRRRWLSQLTEKKPVCSTDILSASSITMNEFAPLLYIIVIGWAFAGIVCAIEILFNG